jgi:hypothetical protein
MRWVAGARQAYDVVTDAAVGVRFPGAARPVRVEARVAGTLVLDVAEMEEGGVRGRFRLARASYAASGGPDRARDLRLGTPFDVTFDADGRPRRFAIPDTVPAEGRVVLEQLVRTFQVVTGRGPRWTVREENGTGTYVADYRAARDGSIVKRKTAFETVAVEATGFEGPFEARVSRSRGTARLGGCWVEAVSLEEDLELLARGETVMTSTLRATLVRLPAVPDLAEAEPAAPAGPRVADPDAELARLVAALDAGGGASASDAHWVRDLLATCPGTAERVVEAIAGGRLDDGAAAALLNALELAGTPEAQAALGTVLEGHAFGRMNRLRAAIALGGVAEPTAEALDSLWRTSERRETGEASEIADTALFALGALAPRSRAADAAVGPVETRLQARLAAARDEDERGILLGALGNARNRALAPAVLPYLDDGSAYVRASAADALGNMPGRETESRLVERLRTEGDPRVRKALAASLARTEEPAAESLEAVEAMVRDEETAATRLEMARFLGENVERHPSSRATLEHLLRKDRSASIRSYAGKVLLRTGYAPPPP